MKTKFKVNSAVCAILLSFLSLISPLSLKAQSGNVHSDTLAFHKYFSGTFADYYPFQMLSNIYIKLQSEQKYAFRIASNWWDIGASSEHMPYPMSGGSPTLMFGTSSSGEVGTGVPIWVEDLQYPVELRKGMLSNFNSCMKSGYTKRKARRALVAKLEAFAGESMAKPMFFADIYDKYDGDIGKYVDDLYKNSILLNFRKLQMFHAYPSVRRLQSDMGVQFVIGLALYELWIKQVREGKVGETKGD